MFFERSEIMLTEEEIRQYEKKEFQEKMVSLAKSFIMLLINVFMVVVIICNLFALFMAMASRLELDPVRDARNIIWWFVEVPALICLPYYFLLKYICKGAKYAGMDKDEREIYWNLFKYLIVTPIIMILLVKTVSMTVSDTATPIWMHYIPILESKFEHYQPIWAEHVNNGYVWLQSHLTFLPPLESLQ